jgi:prolyl oligopeptidase
MFLLLLNTKKLSFALLKKTQTLYLKFIMNKFLFTIFFIFSFQSLFSQKTYKYPITQKGNAVDVYFKDSIKDPYRWMENPTNFKLKEWIAAQNKLKTKEEHKHLKVWVLRNQIASMFYGVVNKKLDGYVEKNNKLKSKYQFEYKFNRLDRFPNLRYRLRGKSLYKTLINSKKFKRNKSDNAVITDRYVNEKEDLVAIEMSHNGSDWREVYFFDLKSGEQLNDHLKYLRADSRLFWDKRNVYYDRFNKPKENEIHTKKAKGQKLFYHKLGTAQSSDKLLFKNIDSTGTNSFNFSKIKNKLFFYHFYKYKNKLFKALSVANNNPDTFFLKNFLIYPNDESINFTIEELFNNYVVLRTNWNAPNGKVLLANIFELNKPKEIIPEYDVILKHVNRLGKDKIACIYRNNSKYLVLIFDLTGKLLKRIDFPEGKKVNYFYENSSEVSYTDFSVSSFYHPDLWYQLSLDSLTFKPSEAVSVPYDPKSLETRYVKYKSKDGTEIPMYITCLKKTKLNGKNPTLLYGYGGYGITVEPSFDEAQGLWLLHGGILAVPNIRGGGAGGSEWSKAGRRLKKQNAIDDFIAAAEYLIKEKYTNSSKLAINGASHGGMLVGAAITQRPELFKVAIAEAAPFDMLHFEKYTIGSTNTNISEFGTVSNREDYFNLKSYSPLQNIKEGVKYPNVLLITGDSDDRVPPFHSYKFLATLQEKGSQKSQYILYITPGSGHGGALTNKDWVDKLLFKYYFLFNQLGLRFY